MDSQTIQEFKREFRPILHLPKGAKRARGVQVQNLENVVGSQNAYNCVLKALGSKQDKYKVKLRKCGTLYFYRK
ncbi:hypothetical protein BXY85_3741 [Roseivirga pacifica]|uniref:Uncharacterized protein n=1 Tax=Roseivirga pacifica TaxID=1267423 RepID=A0A1I0Q9R2_9BACT|nr:hypothetical protein BXY85_3741 [Roseivirga pacifica]SEW23622.1 hypothetical protein SAMN05216290_2134 [Roseivirga pacifica]